MGWRSVVIEFNERPSDPVLEWLKQFCAYAEWYGAGPGCDLREEAGQHLLEVQLDANSDRLDVLTPQLCEAGRTIARDINPEDSELAELAVLVAKQLAEQVVQPDPNRYVTYTRPGREALERLGGEGQFRYCSKRWHCTNHACRTIFMPLPMPQVLPRGALDLTMSSHSA
jgi:hypothetical protein